MVDGRRVRDSGDAGSVIEPLNRCPACIGAHGRDCAEPAIGDSVLAVHRLEPADTAVKIRSEYLSRDYADFMLKVDKTARFHDGRNVSPGFTCGVDTQRGSEVVWVAGRWTDHFKSRRWKWPEYHAKFTKAGRKKLERASVEVPAKIENVLEVSGTKKYLEPTYRRVKDTVWWAFRGAFYISNETDLTQNDVLALLLEEDNKKRLRLERAHALMAMRTQLDERAKRQPIPQDVKVFVWQRDAGRCVECGSQQDLEYDHIIPLVMGGSNTERNLQLLCSVCNRRKGGTLG
jgi:hypothetical protein